MAQHSPLATSAQRNSRDPNFYDHQAGDSSDEEQDEFPPAATMMVTGGGVGGVGGVGGGERSSSGYGIELPSIVRRMSRSGSNPPDVESGHAAVAGTPAMPTNIQIQALLDAQKAGPYVGSDADSETGGCADAVMLPESSLRLACVSLQ
jgi:hypothetical protein